ncbi:hypothetical protein BFU36_07750 [Sulfolobus sp. A20]|nr:hypothetical protein BFU36_07750 [Sulfolobus sp. A20]TRM82190.1 hypothetical protein DJ524_01425 [Sulfolobus sp. D5]TRM84319.1 hypothetical protein DJ522_05115 [Sulfolobus sp. F3]TRM88677.1 hypothetical protein DJ521_01390 [Sulfolobus sp. E3]TRM89668.1 hypothetical protein DJ529_00920 [Sulfolobus sp. C3]TRM90469.1 hypothetical protein DMP16_10550 [Sulfolobus sp. B1]TRM92514.1 hypothetical protein DJ526_05745 [Sulfolobus sp. A20-N-G8]TRN03052.1 hypothetical protein DJ527_02620 [Sulfolobus 
MSLKLKMVLLNMSEVLVGKDDKKYVRIPTRLDDAYHLKSLAEGLQKRWEENEKITNKVKHFHRRAKENTLPEK